ncbi:MAG TPA: AAA family ATPase [Trebonia sp.]|nr:AAA family ATPase [Trebonia sp.]
MTSVVVVRMLGPFTVSARGRAVGAWQRPTARRLCQLVLLSPGRRIGRDLACEELFPGADPRAAARALSKALSMARATLGELGEPGASLLGADLTHIWAAPGVIVDADEHAAALRQALATEPGGGRASALVAALKDEGELLAEEPYADWAMRAREQLESLRQEARLTLARDWAASGSQSSADAVTQAWLSAFDHDQACEEAAGALLHGYLHQGRRELAARVYERCAAALAELGLHTSPSLDELYAAVTQPATATGAAEDPAGGDTARVVAGTGMEADAEAPPREELRLVTLLFAEIAPARRLDPEALREVVTSALAAVIAQVEALDGRVTSVSGPGLQAIWGAPRSHEDDPERALRAAYRALAAAPAMLRIGVETGPAVVGPLGGGGRVSYGALGDVVSVAASLQSLATPGTALVGPVTRAAAGHLFSWGSQERVADPADPAAELAAGPAAQPAVGPAPGPASQPLTASYLGEPLAMAGQSRIATRGPLVGRAAEVAVLEAAFRAARDEGRGSALLLRGEPGLGKTRLVQESRERFLAWVGARSGRLPLWLEGRGMSYASATPYGLYQQLLAGWIGVAPDQPRQVVRKALKDALTALMASAELLPILEHVMGLAAGQDGQGPGPEELRRAAFRALRTVISRLVPARRPGVIVLEDLHWADPTSLSFTRELLALTQDRPLLILATARPDAGPEVDALAGSAQVRTVTLRPLREAAGRDLARALIGPAAGPEVLDTVLATVDGNPLFLEERVAALLETGTLEAVPQVLDRLVRSRIDRLSLAAQEAVRVAAVLGPQFPAQLLADVLRSQAAPDGLAPPVRTGGQAALTVVPHGSSALPAALAELRASEILHWVSGAAEGTYRFRHSLIREAVYHGLLRGERRRLHGHAAAALEVASSGRPQEVAALVGRHFAAADDAPKAVRYLELAGDTATDAFANDEAIAAFLEALAAAASREDADAGARLQGKLANVLWRTARRGETREAFRAGLRLAQRLPDADTPHSADWLRRAHLLTRLGRLEFADGQYDAAAQALDAAAQLLGQEPGADWTDAEVDQWLELMIDGRASLRTHVGDTDGALACLEAARPVLQARGNPFRQHSFYMMSGFQQVLRSRLRAEEQAVADFRRSLAAARQSRDMKDIGYATQHLGWILWLHGDTAEAWECSHEALRIADRVGEVALYAEALGTLAMVALGRHDVAAVRDLATRSVEAARPLGDDYHHTLAQASLAWLAWQDGRPGDVTAIAAEIESVMIRGQAIWNRYRWIYLFPLIAAQLWRDDAEQAVASARPLLDSDQQLLPPELNAAIEAACRAWDSGQADEAATGLRAVLDLARNAGFFLYMRRFTLA